MKRLFAGVVLVCTFIYTVGCGLTPDKRVTAINKGEGK